MAMNDDSIVYHDIINPDYMEEWTQEILNNDESQDFDKQMKQYSAVKIEFIELIINLCEELDFPPEVEFTCIDNFGIFAYQHFLDISKQIMSQITINPLLKTKAWQKMLKLVKEQFMLRIMSLITICAKQYNVNFCVSSEKIQFLLETAGCATNKTEIQASEFRVFKTLDFKIVKPAALESLHMLLNKCVTLPCCSQIFSDLAIRILRFTYLQRDEIYDSLIPLLEESSNMHQIKSDQNLLAAAIIIATANIINSAFNSILFMAKLLSDESCNTENDIIALSQIIFNNIFKCSTISVNSLD